MSRTTRALVLAAIPFLLAGCAGERGDEADASTEEADAGMETGVAEARRAAAAQEAACRPGQTPTAGPVRIALDRNGKIRVDPARVKVVEGAGSVEFTSDRPFVLIFNRKGGVLPTRAATAAAKARSRAPVRVNPRAECGSYKYSVAVWDSAAGVPVGVDPPIDIVPGG